MVTDRQYGRLMKLIQQEPSLATAAAKAGMDEQTARKYRDLGKLPSQTKPERTWKRSDVRARASTRPAGTVGLHVHEQRGRHDCRSAIRSSSVPLHADLFE